MNKSLKAVKKMKGFMCHSPASTAVCMNQDYMSVIVPRNLDRKIVDRAKLINNAKYIRLGEPCKVSTTDHRRPINVSSLKKEKENGHQEVSSIAASHNVYQVVVMRVSLHCQGCAGKVKKHLSKMEGVTSFSIDLESKRVTVRGHVSPSGVLESISKVKRAEFWPS
ncbi:protein SODIUM POTASSIUM ROOT DEFECTIVE 3-like [Olea europaea var. sylvestris]|uniref:Heavy metal-associated isoprenylated plant 3-like n=1 Tax=Olea europaea subsp. europaea TaxID=158383 RepID=A0A8S0TI08_OLEEU|nr:protein SODIUM POTASSIUM ROOT DEFECTIVE 3-like [Olea europaea var. sylvestris]CAA3005266.1 heavy metal-associated isoprenylated plant 3-like [Olea europaea subsp. europaea]CAA3005267.1 heavy metal-associated isoprenylated plant 3-like [Olea europaea subsp. europaea]CAA3005268.1 heavy metal-associated isoprenylated plant 3-like [Olea europaea subsp. europaea]